MRPDRLRGPQLGGRPARRPGQKKRDPTWHRTARCRSLLMCNQEGRTRGIATGVYLDLGFAGLSGRAARAGGRHRGQSTPAAPGTAGDTALRVRRLRATDQPGPRRARPHLGRPAVGGARGDAGLSATARGLSPLWGADGADRVCRSQSAGHAPLAPADRAGLPVDADQPRGRAAPRQLGQSAARRKGLLDRLGSHPPDTAAVPHRSR